MFHLSFRAAASPKPVSVKEGAERDLLLSFVAKALGIRSKGRLLASLEMTPRSFFQHPAGSFPVVLFANRFACGVKSGRFRLVLDLTDRQPPNS